VFGNPNTPEAPEARSVRISVRAPSGESPGSLRTRPQRVFEGAALLACGVHNEPATGFCVVRIRLT
jgi:hypothetical protein